MARVTKESRRLRIKRGIRKRLSGSVERPRLSVFRSNTTIYAQIVDDTTGKTLVAASSIAKDLGNDKMTKVDASKAVGVLIAQRAQAAGLSKVVFDRNGYLYHGRVKALAEGAREGGLQF